MKTLFIQNHSDGSFLCSLALALQLRDARSKVIILAYQNIEKVIPGALAKVGVESIPLSDVDRLKAIVSSTSSVEYVAWFHEIGLKSAQRFFSAIKSYNPSCRVTLSFIPDGFANKYGSTRLYERFLSLAEGLQVTIGTPFLFFSLNEVSKRAVTWAPIEVISPEFYHEALEVFSASMELVGLLADLNGLLEEGVQHKLCVVPTRPWCSAFHGGKYLFGDRAESLKRIYEDIFALANVDGKTFFIFRGDDRGDGIQKEVIGLFAQESELRMIDISEHVPPMITIETILFHLWNCEKVDFDLSLVTLDSCTPFPVSALNKSFDIFAGARHSVLRKEGASEENIKYISLLTNGRSALTHGYCAAQSDLTIEQYQMDGLIHQKITLS